MKMRSLVCLLVLGLTTAACGDDDPTTPGSGGSVGDGGGSVGDGGGSVGDGGGSVGDGGGSVGDGGGSVGDGGGSVGDGGGSTGEGGGDGAGRDGTTCEANADCEGALCFSEEGSGFPSGYCAGECDAAAGGGCAGAGVCVAATAGSGLCADPCSPTDPCRAGYTCLDYYGDGSTMVCMPACTSNRQCPATGYCAPNGYCAEPVGPVDPARADGVPCSTDDTCQGGLCLDELGWGSPSGACSGNCAATGVCQGGGICVRQGNGALCLASCSDADPCRDGYICLELQGGGGVCFPDCESDAQCQETGYCDGDGFCSIP